jgi:Glycosyl transferase family 2
MTQAPDPFLAMSSSLAPIAFFAYKRPEHTKRSLESLAKNHGAELSEVFIFCDGAKKSEDNEAVTEVRQIVKSQQWCGQVHIIEREQNIGLANSIIQGVTELCRKYGRVIVLEDDLVLSPFFLEYMNQALDLYEKESKVIQISGYMFPINLISSSDAIFLPFTTSWGWATWDRAWKYFDPKMSGYDLLSNDRRLKHKFNLNNSYPYFEMLEQQINGKIDSWAIRWYLSTFLIDGITLYPIQTLVQNTGFDGSGTHCGVASLSIDIKMSQDKILSMPNNIHTDNIILSLVFRYLHQINQHLNFCQRIKQSITNLFRHKHLKL